MSQQILRTVGDPAKRFTEDALRILRGVRFAVRYDLTPEAETEAAMLGMTALMDNLARERVFDELCKLLPTVGAEDLIRFAPVIVQVIPELAQAVGFDQHSVHHAYDVYTHTAHVVQAVPATLPLRWAALLHDVGKPQTFTRDKKGEGHFPEHSQVGADMANQILLRLKAPNALREQVAFLVEAHMLPLPPDKKVLRRRVSKFGRENIQNLLHLQMADRLSTGVHTDITELKQVQALLEEILQEGSCLQIKDLAIDGTTLVKLGMKPGPQMGKTLSRLLDLVLNEQIPNEANALMEEAKKDI